MAALLIFDKSRTAVVKDKVVSFEAEGKTFRVHLVNGEKLSFTANTEEECEGFYNDLLEFFRKE